MMRSILCAGTLLLASSAWALKPGDTIFVRARDTRVLKSPGATAVVAKLQLGDKLTWKGQSKKDPHYHEVVTASGKAGVVWYQNLSTSAPKEEVVVDADQGSGKKVNAQAFASYGAAARGLTASTKKVASSANKGEVAKKLEAAESIARALDPKEEAK